MHNFMNKFLIGLFAVLSLCIGCTTVSAQNEVEELSQRKPVPNSTIEVLKPTAGSQVKPGDTIFFAVKKTGKDATANISASVSGPGYGSKDFVIGTNLNTGVFAWKVPAQIEEGTYVVMVRSTKSQSFARVPLKVYQKKTITVTSPNGGERYKVGDKVRITWKTNLSASTSIALQLEDTRFKGDVAEHFSPIPSFQVQIPNTGSYEWTIPEVLNEYMKIGATGAVYRVGVADYGDGSVSDWSNGKFSIAPALTTSSPVLSRGTTYSSKKYVVNGDDVTEALANSFVVNAKDGTILDTITVGYTTASSTISNPTSPTTIYVFEKRGAVTNLLSSKIATEITTFSGLNSAIKPKEKVEYIVSFDMPANTKTGSAVQVFVKDIKLVNGVFSKDSVSLPIIGAPMFFTNSREPVVGKASYKIAARPTIQQVSSNQNGSTTAITASFQLLATASGGTVTPKNTDFVVRFQKGNPTEHIAQNSVVASAINVTTIPMKPIVSGGSASVTVVATITPRELGGSGIYYAQLSTPDGQKINTDWGVQVIAKNESFTASVMDAIRQMFGF